MMRPRDRWNEFYLTIGKSIKAEREQAGKTLKEVAEAIGLSNEAVLHRYETGARRPLPHILLELGRFLKNDEVYFLTHAEVPREVPQATSTGPVYDQIRMVLREHTETKALLQTLLPLISHTLNVGVISAFEYQWMRSELRKFSEHITASVPLPVTRAAMPKKLPAEDLYFYESYNVWQERYVTELAWAHEEEEYRFITNYKRIHSSYPRRVNMASYTWHEQISGKVLSTMYGTIGTPEKQYLIRCFNRSDHVGGLLDRNQYQTLGAICRLVSAHVDAVTLDASFRRLRDVGAHLTSDPQSLPFHLKLLCDQLREEGAASGLFLWNTTHGAPLQYAYTFGDHFHAWKSNHSTHTEERGFVEADLWARIRGNESYFVVDVFEEMHAVAACTLEAYINAWNELQRRTLSGTEIGCLLVLPFNRDEQQRGALIIPIEVGPRSPSPTEGVAPGATHPPKMDIVRAIPTTIQTLNAYASIAQNVIVGVP
jgi:transcriptional regulator with XRE-family HTH domain